jgi:hypothetical protein
VQNLDILEDLIDEDRMMAATMRQGWTLSIVFEVERGDGRLQPKNIKFKHEKVHSHELGMMVGLDSQSVQGMADINVRRHSRVG